MERDLRKVQGLLPAEAEKGHSEDVEMHAEDSLKTVKNSKSNVTPIDLSSDSAEEGGNVTSGLSKSSAKFGKVATKDLQAGTDASSSIVLDGTPPSREMILSNNPMSENLPDLDALLASIHADSATLPSESTSNTLTNAAGLSEEITALFASLPPLNDVDASINTLSTSQPTFDLSMLSGQMNAPANSAASFDFSSLTPLNPNSNTPNEMSNNNGEEFDLDKLLASFE